MENALLIGLSRQMALKNRMDVIANNMANVNTAGYKSDQLVFEEYLMPVADITDAPGADGQLSYVYDAGIVRSFTAGSIEKSGNELDVAISGDGWLSVDSPEGPRYTRNGQLKIDNQGTLVTSEGLPVLGEGGPITFEPGNSNIVIADDGTISTNQGIKGKLAIVRFENPASLTKEGHSIYSSSDTPEADFESRVMQGFVEKSNVQPVLELTRLIETVRAYTSTSQTLQKTSELRNEAINQLGGQNSA